MRCIVYGRQACLRAVYAHLHVHARFPELVLAKKKMDRDAVHTLLHSVPPHLPLLSLALLCWFSQSSAFPCICPTLFRLPSGHCSPVWTSQYQQRVGGTNLHDPLWRPSSCCRGHIAAGHSTKATAASLCLWLVLHLLSNGSDHGCWSLPCRDICTKDFVALGASHIRNINHRPFAFMWWAEIQTERAWQNMHQI